MLKVDDVKMGLKSTPQSGTNILKCCVVSTYWLSKCSPISHQDFVLVYGNLLIIFGNHCNSCTPKSYKTYFGALDPLMDCYLETFETNNNIHVQCSKWHNFAPKTRAKLERLVPQNKIIEAHEVGQTLCNMNCCHIIRATSWFGLVL